MPTVIGAVIAGGATIYGAHAAAKGNTDAAKTQAGSDAAALAQAKEIYQQQRADESPYRESGYGAMDALNFGLGLPPISRMNATATAPKPMSTVKGLEFPGAPQVPQDTLNTLDKLKTSGLYGGLAGKMQDKINTAQGLVNDKYGTTGATVRIKAPNGFIYLVGNDQVEAAKAKGGVVV